MTTWGSVGEGVLDRACANCGTRYPPADPACPNCFRPAEVAYSRLRGGPTSFGLPTKLVIAGILVGLNVAHAAYLFSAVSWAAWPRVIEVGVLLLVPIPFLFRRTRVR